MGHHRRTARRRLISRVCLFTRWNKGTWTFFGGHDPEDPQHAIGNAPTDLSLHPHSPGYRLILNNVLFPAAKKKELKT